MAHPTRIRRIAAGAGILLVLVAATARPSGAQKMTAEQLIARHLDAIGNAKARAAITTRIMSGTAQVIFRTSPAGQAVGKAVLASEGNRQLLGMSFPSPVYPREQLAFNGIGFMAAFATPGTRSVLGNFLMTNDAVFKQGLMCGVLSSGWPLLNSERRAATIDYVGTRKIDGRILHELRYTLRGTSDLKITVYFDATDFRHVRTEYERVIPAPMGRVEYSNVQEREGRYKMIEDFSLFKTEGELTLPHIYTIKLSVDTINGTFLAEWTIKLTNFEFNQPIDPAAFNVSAP
jgi:outer membrane lipoprotein-sorting protein